MNTYAANITIMPLKELLDPQGKAVTGSLHNLGMVSVKNVRVGKHITLQIDAADKESAKTMAEDACKKLLANMVMERYEVTIEEIA